MLQTQFLPAFLPGATGFVPDLVLLIVVAWSLLLDWRWSIPLGFAAGLVLDLMAPAVYPIGLSALLFTLIAFFVSFAGQDPFHSGIVRSVPIALLAAITYRICRLLVERMLSYNNLQPAIFLQAVLPVVILDAVLMLFVFVLIRLISRIQTAKL